MVTLILKLNVSILEIFAFFIKNNQISKIVKK